MQRFLPPISGGALDYALPTHFHGYLGTQNAFLVATQLFATNMMEANKIVIESLSKLKSAHGHIVVRVAPGGRANKPYESVRNCASNQLDSQV